MRKLFTILAVLTAFVATKAYAQPTNICPPSYVFKPQQDCPGAIPLCRLEYRFADSVNCGEGNLLDEAVGSCGTNERNTTWYQFIARRDGRLRFRIIPNDVTGQALTDYSSTNGDGNTDYDFVLFKMPPGTIRADSAVCRLLAPPTGGGRNPYEVSCNYSGQDGVTGIYDEQGATATGVTRFATPIQVRQGDHFILLVDNFRVNNRVGYRIVFDDPDSIAQATDPRVTSDSARFDRVVNTPNCKNNALTFNFNKPVLCQGINTFTFGIGNSHFPGNTFTIDSVRGKDCINYDDAYTSSQQWSVYFSPALIDSTYYLYLNQSITDICGNRTTRDTIPFRIRPYIRLEAFSGENKTDSACCGTEIVFKATPDENLGAPIRTFNYAFTMLDTVSNTYGPLPSNLYRVDSNRITTLAPECTPFRERLRFKVVASNPRFGCRDSATTLFRYNPKPPKTLANVPGLCFGETAQIEVFPAPADSSLFQYEWTSKLRTTPVQRFPRRGALTIISDTTDRVDIETGTVYRSSNDELTLKVNYKSQFGGCFADPQKATIASGAYMKAAFRADTIQRPGKLKPTFILADRSYFDESRVYSLDGIRNNNRPELWTVTNTATKSVIYRLNTYGPVPDSVQVSFRDSSQNNAVIEGDYIVRLVLSDTLYKGTDLQKVCLAQDSLLYNVVDPVIPNILTTNGDNSNDYFEIPDLLKSRNYTLTVINRWGRVVFKQSNYDNTFKASDFPSGTYFYNLEPSVSGRTYKGWLEVLKK